MDGKAVCSTKKTDTYLHTGITDLYKAEVQFELLFLPIFYVKHLMCVSTNHICVSGSLSPWHGASSGCG